MTTSKSKTVLKVKGEELYVKLIEGEVNLTDSFEDAWDFIERDIFTRLLCQAGLRKQLEYKTKTYLEGFNIEISQDILLGTVNREKSDLDKKENL